ncbi:hypothetical protein ABEB36_004636 [Hypothenemus hampei]|uniref:Uncharacterized protein n=1 Tax=Hypothenemus hampei TaxID=57062 RepID=A0ABD1F3Y6_HYPHA
MATENISYFKARKKYPKSYHTENSDSEIQESAQKEFRVDDRDFPQLRNKFRPQDEQVEISQRKLILDRERGSLSEKEIIIEQCAKVAGSISQEEQEELSMEVELDDPVEVKIKMSNKMVLHITIN